MSNRNVRTGILGIGTYLPPTVRTNEWWPRQTVERWLDRHVWDKQKKKEYDDQPPPAGMARVLAKIEQYRSDPFHGARERRVMDERTTAGEMSHFAAKEALEQSGIDRGEIDLLLSNAFIPDHLGEPHACVVHRRLGLSPECITFDVDAVCNSFQMQLGIAESMIAAGRIRYALLVQTSAVSRVNPLEESFAIHFGDGATAVVVGPVSRGRGVLSQVHRTDGRAHGAMVCTVPDKQWWEEGRIWAVCLNRSAASRMFLSLADLGKEVVSEALVRAELSRSDVDFFACHQATVWFREVTQSFLELKQAKTVDTYTWAGTLSGANLPLVLFEGQRLGLLSDGDLVAMFQGGTGMTYSATVLRWGK